MSYFFLILLKMNISLALFSTAYYLILRRLTFYTINRAFLVFGILFSTVYPFLDLTAFWQNQHQVYPRITEFVPTINGQVNTVVSSVFKVEYGVLAGAIFWTGVVLMGTRFILQLVSLHKLHKRSKPGIIVNHPVRILNEPVSPFSFWKTIYINPSLHKKTELANILAHENVHIKDWHTLDILLIELSVVFYWFNPGVWLMKKVVKENLEFITDNKILRMGIEKKVYQYSLLNVGNLRVSTPVGNSFSFSHLKKRIEMMNAKRSSPITLSRYFLLLPALLLVTLAFTVSKKEAGKLKPSLQAFFQQRHANVHYAEPAIQPAGTGKAKENGLALVHPAAKRTPGFRGSQVKQEDTTSSDPFETADDKTITASSVRTLTEPVSLHAPVDQIAGDYLQPAVNKLKLKDDEIITVVGYRTPRKARIAGEAEREPVHATDTVSSDTPLPTSSAALPYKVVIGYKLPRSQSKSGR